MFGVKEQDPLQRNQPDRTRVEGNIIEPAEALLTMVLEAAANDDTVRRVVIASSRGTLIPFEWNFAPDSDKSYTRQCSSHCEEAALTLYSRRYQFQPHETLQIVDGGLLSIVGIRPDCHTNVCPSAKAPIRSCLLAPLGRSWPRRTTSSHGLRERFDARCARCSHRSPLLGTEHASSSPYVGTGTQCMWPMLLEPMSILLTQLKYMEMRSISSALIHRKA